jgi:hypothetical protein
MYKLMHHNVFKTLSRLLSQFEVDPNTAGVDGASAPFGLHFLNTERRYLDAKPFLPFAETDCLQANDQRVSRASYSSRCRAQPGHAHAARGHAQESPAARRWAHRAFCVVRRETFSFLNIAGCHDLARCVF